MKRSMIFIAGLIFAVCMIVAFKGCGGCPGGVSEAVCKAARTSGIATSTEIQQTTPAGTRTAGVTSLNARQLASIDAGLAGAFADARVSGYTAALVPAFYSISTPISPCVLSPVDRVPSFYVRADSYDGTEFDQYNSKGPGVRDGTGVVMAAEMVLSLGTPGSTLEYGWMVVCPDENVIADAARNGGEHIIIANNDSEYYGITWFHGYGFYHPLLPKRDPPSAGRPAPINQGSSLLIRAVR